jgi:hypothetical protein
MSTYLTMSTGGCSYFHISYHEYREDVVANISHHDNSKYVVVNISHHDTGGMQ